MTSSLSQNRYMTNADYCLSSAKTSSNMSNRIITYERPKINPLERIFSVNFEGPI